MNRQQKKSRIKKIKLNQVYLTQKNFLEKEIEAERIKELDFPKPVLSPKPIIEEPTLERMILNSSIVTATILNQNRD